MIKTGMLRCILQCPLSCMRNKAKRKAEKKAMDRYSRHLDIQSMIESDLIVKNVF